MYPHTSFNSQYHGFEFYVTQTKGIIHLCTLRSLLLKKIKISFYWLAVTLLHICWDKYERNSRLPSNGQIQNLELEIEEKRKQMRVLEQRIVESGEASVGNTSMVEMQQVVFFIANKSHDSTLLIYNNLRFLVWLCYFLPLYQTVAKLMAQCSEKCFELEVSLLSSLIFLLQLFVS